jgi:hypothetical protein
VAIGTDCRDSCKANYHTITTVPESFMSQYLHILTQHDITEILLWRLSKLYQPSVINDDEDMKVMKTIYAIMSIKKNK